jgi:hypothetical protein
MPCISHPSLITHPNNKELKVQIMKLLTVQFSPVLYYFTSLCTLFSNIIHLHHPVSPKWCIKERCKQQTKFVLASAPEKLLTIQNA